MRHRRAALALAAVLLIAGCSEDSGEQTQTQADSQAQPPSEESGAEAALPEPTPVRGAERVDLDQRLVRKVSIQEGPDWMAFGFGSLWVKRDSGIVDRVNPANGEVIAEIRTGAFKNPLCQGIGVSEDAVWTCPPGAGEVVRIDPATNKITATLKIDKLPDQGRLVSAGGALWVLTDAGEQLTSIDLRTTKPGQTIALGSRCLDLAAQGDTLWAMCPFDDLLLRIDAEAAQVTDEVELAGAQNGSVGEDVWVGFDGGLAQIDPKKLEVEAVYDVYPKYGGSIFAGTDAVWVREENGHFLTRIDPDKRQIVETIEAPRLPSGGDVIAIGDSVWATAFDDATLVQLQAPKP